MIEDRKLLVGLDLCNDYTQISCYSMKTYEPESICYTNDDSKYMIPTVLGVREDTKDWLFGEEALLMAKSKEALLVDNILERIIRKEEIYIYDVRFTGSALLEKFFRKTLSLLKRYYPNETVSKLVITIKELDMALIHAIYKALDSLSLGKERVSIQSHSQSAIYYAMSQKRELWINNVAIFDFEEAGLQYYHLDINRKTSPMSITIDHKDLSDTLSLDLLEDLNDKESISYIFENLAKSVLYRQLITTLYMTGRGFEGNWADEVFKKLCVGRRVFKGQNLYTKGACYYARELAGEGKCEDFIFLTEEMVSSSIGLQVYKDAMLEELTLVNYGTLWYEARHQVQLILDEQDSITIVVKDYRKKNSNQHVIELEGITKRPNRMTRVELRTEFVDTKTCTVMVKDMGFGSYYPSTNQIWEYTIRIE
ncbi:MAG TPA: DUF5716 family protein [Lachnospiraceae bacterium]|nr:DUF5716 family protein [Lachnospiraceae bacterium]